ncbi:hypothetical protein [Halorubellus sp. PRR65]|uniref:DUF7511 domain-containing protein n=1 Tax=Halorubellus sp. PRR65 TaxID=3098148 RepID=UPI002B25ED0E|nr:hypothetical protein [Halorubellus sp. PRR65]
MAAPTSPPDPGTDDDSDGSVGAQRRRDDASHDSTQTTDAAVELVTLVEETDDGRRCTVCPADSDATDLVTTWLTVDADALCDLDEWR